MSLLVVGSVAYDVVETPFGKCEKMLGGSASHFSIAASFFTNVSIVGVVGGDFTDYDIFAERRVNISDLERIEDGKTFRWGGRYDYDLNVAHTLFTDLNVFADFQPIMRLIPLRYLADGLRNLMIHNASLADLRSG